MCGTTETLPLADIATEEDVEYTDDEVQNFMNGREELPRHTKHNKGVKCARCTLDRRIKQFRKATGIYVDVAPRRPAVSSKPSRRPKPHHEGARSYHTGHIQRHRQSYGSRRDATYVEGPPVRGMRRVLRSLHTLLDAETGQRFPADLLWTLPDQAEHPEYYAIVASPMSLGMMESKLTEMGYPTKAAFEADLARVFENALAYYLPGTQAHDDVLHVQANALRAAQQAFSEGRQKRVANNTLQTGDPEEEEEWARSMRQRENHELREKRVVHLCQEDREQALANEWMFGSSPSAEEKRQQAELDRLLQYDFGMGEEFFLDGAIPSPEEKVTEEVIIPVVRDLGNTADTSYDYNVTVAFNDAYGAGYIRRDHDDDLPAPGGSPRLGRGHRPFKTPNSLQPKTPSSSARSTSTVPGMSPMVGFGVPRSTPSPDSDLSAESDAMGPELHSLRKPAACLSCVKHARSTCGTTAAHRSCHFLEPVLQSTALTVEFASGPLGITFVGRGDGEKDRSAKVEAVTGQAELLNIPRGTIVQSINGEGMLGGSFQELMTVIRAGHWPLRITFVFPGNSTVFGSTQEDYMGLQHPTQTSPRKRQKPAGPKVAASPTKRARTHTVKGVAGSMSDTFSPTFGSDVVQSDGSDGRRVRRPPKHLASFTPM